MSDNATLNFTSLSWKRLLCAIILTTVGIMDLIIFSPLMGRHIPTGSVMTFEGPSYFITTGLIPFLVGIGLILYAIFSFFKGEVINKENEITFAEKRYKKVVETKIKKEKLLGITLSNNEIAVKYLWLFLFIPYSIVNYYYMMLNFNQPFIVGSVNTTAVFILISIILSLIAMIILFAFPQWLLEIYTEEGKYELWFEPFRNGREIIKNISTTLEIIGDSNREETKIKVLKNISIQNLLLALFFLSYGLFNMVSFMTTLAIFQTVICYILVIMSVYLLSKELRKLPMPVENNLKSNIRYNLKSKYYQKYFYLKKSDEREVKYLHNDFEVFWGICTAIIFMIISFKVIQIWMVINETNIEYILDNAIIMTIFGVLIMLLVAIYVYIPKEFASIKSGDVLFKEPISKTNTKVMNNNREKFRAFKENFKDPFLKKGCFKRTLYIIICVVLGVLALLWEYFFYFNVFNIFNL